MNCSQESMGDSVPCTFEYIYNSNRQREPVVVTMRFIIEKPDKIKSCAFISHITESSAQQRRNEIPVINF